ncbi:MAG TPA: hypothetical protein VF599_00095, partial [Pyrinomonadaceae bacterium]
LAIFKSLSDTRTLLRFAPINRVELVVIKAFLPENCRHYALIFIKFPAFRAVKIGKRAEIC